MLVIPSIEISHERCTRRVHSDAEDLYGSDPVETARLWRRENAKSIHLTDIDGLESGERTNRELIVGMAAELEIPMQLISRFGSVEECREWLDAGIYRIVLHDLVQLDPEGVRALVAEYGQSRIIGGAITREGRTMRLLPDATELDLLDYASRVVGCGIGRILSDDRDFEGMLRGPNFEELELLATRSGLRVTAAGGVASVEQLWKLQQMESIGIDSVVIGRAFYENLFPCQQLWRDIELERGAGGDISTAGLAGS